MKDIHDNIKLPRNDTRTTILTELLGKDMTAIQLMDELEINESAVRKHLKRLEERGLIQHEFRKVKKGRPKKFFKLTDKGAKVFPRREDMFLNIFIRKVVDRFGEKGLHEVLDLVLEELLEYFPKRGDESLENALNEMVERFNELGFYASLSEDEDGYIIEYKNCVFEEVADELGGEMCRIHRGILSKALGDVEVDNETSQISGDKVCRQRIIRDDA